MCIGLASRTSKAQNFKNTYFDKSYGFHTDMQKHIVRPQKVLWVVYRSLKA
jgi:hypothetical protein